jgi:hypothetical protein
MEALKVKASLADKFNSTKNVNCHVSMVGADLAILTFFKKIIS